MNNNCYHKLLMYYQCYYHVLTVIINCHSENTNVNRYFLFNDYNQPTIVHTHSSTLYNNPWFPNFFSLFKHP